MASIYNPATWLGLTTFIAVSYLPLVIFWFYTVYRQAASGTDNDIEWFHSTMRGLWRIPAKVFLGWFLTFAAKGVAQFFAWESNLDSDGLPKDPLDDQWEYPAAMMLFLLSIFLDCLWLGAFFSVHNRFLTSTVFLLLQSAVTVFLVVLYFMLSITAGVILVVYSILVTLPLVVISALAYRSHGRDAAQRPKPKTELDEERLLSQSPKPRRQPAAETEPRPKSAPVPKKRPNAPPGGGAVMSRKKQLESLGLWPKS